MQPIGSAVPVSCKGTTSPAWGAAPGLRRGGPGGRLFPLVTLSILTFFPVLASPKRKGDQGLRGGTQGAQPPPEFAHLDRPLRTLSRVAGPIPARSFPGRPRGRIISVRNG